MRITPSGDSLEWLQSIGITDSYLTVAVHTPAVKSNSPSKPKQQVRPHDNPIPERSRVPDRKPMDHVKPKPLVIEPVKRPDPVPEAPARPANHVKPNAGRIAPYHKHSAPRPIVPIWMIWVATIIIVGLIILCVPANASTYPGDVDTSGEIPSVTNSVEGTSDPTENESSKPGTVLANTELDDKDAGSYAEDPMFIELKDDFTMLRRELVNTVAIAHTNRNLAIFGLVAALLSILALIIILVRSAKMDRPVPGKVEADMLDLVIESNKRSSNFYSFIYPNPLSGTTSNPGPDEHVSDTIDKPVNSTPVESGSTGNANEASKEQPISSDEAKGNGHSNGRLTLDHSGDSTNVPDNRKAGRNGSTPPATVRETIKVMEPDELLPFLVTETEKRLKRRNAISDLRIASFEPWTVGSKSIQGKVRKDNQDYGLHFKIREYDVVISADGVGGEPHGQIASYLAVMLAAFNIILTLLRTKSGNRPDPVDLARSAMDAASRGIMGKAEKLGILPGDGLCTTLIIAIGNRERFGYGYIGDGGGYVVHPDGEVEKFIEPHKGDPNRPNIISACLGPKILGSPCFGSIDRRNGDFLIIGTDGVFDKVDPDTISDTILAMLKRAHEFDGSLDDAIGSILHEFANYNEKGWFPFDDNLTLGFICDGTLPFAWFGSLDKSDDDDGDDEGNETETDEDSELIGPAIDEWKSEKRSFWRRFE